MAGRSDGRGLISIVIPARNEEVTIQRAILPLLTDPVDADVEVIIADGRSTDRTREVVESLAAHDSRVQLIDNPAMLTPEGLNAAIRASRGDVIIRMDGHAEPESCYLATCLTVLRTSQAWNVGGRMMKVGASEAGRAASAATTSSFGIGGGRRFHLIDEPVDSDTVWLGCWPRWVFEQIGLFDPEMTHVEDEEFNQRILDAGGRIRFDPSIGAAYVSRASWRGLMRQYYRYGLFKVGAIQKRPTLLRIRHFVPAAFLAAVMGGLIGGLLVPWAPVLAISAIGVWLATAIAFGRRVAGRFGATVPGVVLAYACLHAGYGLGMWVGFVRFAPRWFIHRRGEVPVLEARKP